MKTREQIKDLIEFGFKKSTILNLTEGQISNLHKRLTEKKEPKEAVTKTSTTTTYDLSADMDRKELENKLGSKGVPAFVDPATKKVTISSGEVKEDDSLGALAMQDYTGQEGPHDEKDMAPDGMDDDSDNDRSMMGESRKKKSKAKNPWAICTATMGKEYGTTERSDWTKKQMNKYEKCVKDVKKSIKEGKDPYEVILERNILTLLEREMYPTMTKAELMKAIKESKSSAPAPTKPDVKPDVKPGTSPTRRRRPGQVPGPDPAPKAKSEDEMMDEYMDLISKILRNEK